jgi:hypothetical protein
MELPSIQERKGEGKNVSWFMQTLKLRTLFLIQRNPEVSMNQQSATPSLLPGIGPKGAPLHLTNPIPTTSKLPTTGFPCTFQAYKTSTLGALRFKNDLIHNNKKYIWFYPHSTSAIRDQTSCDK